MAKTPAKAFRRLWSPTSESKTACPSAPAPSRNSLLKGVQSICCCIAVCWGVSAGGGKATNLCQRGSCWQQYWGQCDHVIVRQLMIRHPNTSLTAYMQQDLDPGAGETLWIQLSGRSWLQLQIMELGSAVPSKSRTIQVTDVTRSTKDLCLEALACSISCLTGGTGRPTRALWARAVPARSHLWHALQTDFFRVRRLWCPDSPSLLL